MRRGCARTLPPMRRLVCVLVVLLFAQVSAAGGATAQAPEPGRGIDVSPDPASPRKSPAGTLAELGELQPGQPLQDAVIIRSNLPDPQEVYVYSADAIPAVGGGFGFDARTEPKEQVGAWLTLDVERVIIPPGGQVRVGYTVQVPVGTPGGEYVGAVVAEPVLEQAGPGVQTLTRFAMAAYLRVPGGAPGATPGRGSAGGKLVIQQLRPRFDEDKACPTVTLRNDSQDIVDPTVRVTADGPLTPQQSIRREKAGAVLPGTQAEVALPCIDRPIGPGRLTVEITSPTGTSMQAADDTWLPWPYVLAALALLLLMLALLFLLLRGLQRGRREEQPDSAERAGG